MRLLLTPVYLLLQKEAFRLNKQEADEEKARMNLPSNHKSVQLKIDWETAEEEAKRVRNCTIFSCLLLLLVI